MSSQVPSKPATDLAAPFRPDREHANLSGLQFAAARWREFPVDAHPRPLVLTSPPIGVGTLTTVEAQAAVRDGLLAVDDTVPAAAVDAIRMAGLLRADLADAHIRVTSALPSSMGFGTDRGGRQLPAWLLSITEVDGTCYVMDAASQSLAFGSNEPVTSVHRFGGYAKVLGDGLTVRVDFDPPWLTRQGGPASTAVDVLETATVVVFAPAVDHEPIDHEPIDPEAASGHEGSKAVSFRLAEPLGARVLCDVAGSPLIVGRRKRNDR